MNYRQQNGERSKQVSSHFSTQIGLHSGLHIERYIFDRTNFARRYLSDLFFANCLAWPLCFCSGASAVGKIALSIEDSYKSLYEFPNLVKTGIKLT